MNKLNLNIPLTIFLTGAIMFLFAPFEMFDAFTTHDIFMTGLLIELAGITASMAVFTINRLNGKTM